MDGPTAFPVDRRDFVKLTATGLLVLFAVDRAGAIQETGAPQTTRQGYPTDLNAYLHIGADGRVTCFVGQGRNGAGRDDVAPAAASPRNSTFRSPSVDIVMGDTDLCPWDMGTFGSLSIRQFGPVLRQAAAEARGGAAADGGRAAAGAGRPARREGGRRQRRDGSEEDA